MKRIEKQESPSFYSAYINKNKPKLWDDIAPIRTELRKQIWAEQGGVCAYTEIRLPDPDKNCHIDHFRTRNLFPEKTFEYANLLVACNLEHCGAKYKDKQIKNKAEYTDLIDPSKEAASDYFDYRFTGKVKPEGESPKGERTIRIFNLNETKLVERRKEALFCLQSLMELTLEETVGAIGEFETMVRQLYHEIKTLDQ